MGSCLGGVRWVSDGCLGSQVVFGRCVSVSGCCLMGDGWCLGVSGGCLVSVLVASGAIAFPRCVLGESYKKEGWMLMGFWDGGKPASACCLYARTPLREKGPEGKTHLVRLLAGKARVTPTSSAQGRTRTSTPRTEMRGLLMLTRLIDELLPGI